MPKVIRKRLTSTITETQHTVLHSVGWPHVHVRSNTWGPPTDLYETEDNYIVRMEIAGLQEDDFTVSLEENYLVVSGVRRDIHERRAYHQMEIQFGKFTVSVGVPGPVDVDSATAEYSEGFLTVVLPKVD